MATPEAIPGFDLYAELGVGRSASTVEIESAWRRRIRATHPDVASSDIRATGRSARLNVARTWLTDPDRRARYDALRWPADQGIADVPPLDPLGGWPARPARPSAPSSVGPLIAAVSLMTLMTMILIGTGTSFVTASITLVAAVLLAFYGLLWLLRFLSR
jgi:curved DNA-binding protein CbpA